MLLKELTIEEGWVVSNYCFTDSPDICLNFKYGLFKKISPSLCRFFTENCVEAGLVQIIDESDGSIGNDIREVIYGIINDPLTNEVYVLPLLTFDYLNEVLNFIDE